jgi:hypothetical protein
MEKPIRLACTEPRLIRAASSKPRQPLCSLRVTFFRNLVMSRAEWHNASTMSQSPATPLETSPRTPTPRAFRVKVRGSILALLRLPNRREIRGKIHQISTSGGLINVENPLDEKLKLELIFQIGETTIRQQAEMLFPMWATQGWLQPFRFIDVKDADKAVLETNLHALMRPPQ